MITRSTIALLVVLIGHQAIAQEPAKPVLLLKPSTLTVLMVEVTISRHMGDKLQSSTPYQLSVIPGGGSQLRMGGEVPVPTTTFTPIQKDDGKPVNPLTSFSYRSIGTNIDVNAGQVTDGQQYRLTVTIEETSIYPPESSPPSTKVTGAPAFRRYQSENALALRDGQSLNYTMATDRISGEVYRVNVKLTVVK